MWAAPITTNHSPPRSISSAISRALFRGSPDRGARGEPLAVASQPGLDDGVGHLADGVALADQPAQDLLLELQGHGVEDGHLLLRRLEAADLEPRSRLL